MLAVAVVVLSAACASTSEIPAGQPAAQTSFIEIRFAETEPAGGAETFAFRDSTVFLGPAVLRDDDITAVATQLREGALQMMLYPTTEADMRLYRATAERVGASLALVVDGEARSVVQLRSAMGGGGMIGVGFAATDSVAQRLAAEIAARFPQPEAGH